LYDGVEMAIFWRFFASSIFSEPRAVAYISDMPPSASSLQLLLGVCEKELEYLDMTINVKKSSCLSIGSRYNSQSSCITTSNGGDILWGDTLRYLGVFITARHRFSCSLSNAKKSFYRTFNCIFGKVGRVASENVVY